jgi:hypothetical protein
MSTEPSKRVTVRFQLLCCYLVVLAVLAPAALSAVDTYEVILEYDVSAKMRDGAVLRSDICRSESRGPIPGAADANTVRQE